MTPNQLKILTGGREDLAPAVEKINKKASEPSETSIGHEEATDILAVSGVNEEDLDENGELFRVMDELQWSGAQMDELLKLWRDEGIF